LTKEGGLGVPVICGVPVTESFSMIFVKGMRFLFGIPFLL